MCMLPALLVLLQRACPVLSLLTQSLFSLVAVLLSLIMPLNGYAVFIQFPFDISLNGDIPLSAQSKQQFSKITVMPDGDDISIALLPQAQRGYVRLASSAARPVEEGDLIVFVAVMDSGQGDALPEEIGLGLFSQDWAHSPNQLFEGGSITQSMAGFIGGCPVYHKAGDKIALGEAVIRLPESRGATIFSFGLMDVPRGSIQFANAGLKIGDTDIPLDYLSSTGSAPNRDILVVLYYGTQKNSELHAHVLRSMDAAQVLAERTLTTVDLQSLAMLTTLDKVSSLARSSGIDNSIIENIKRQHSDDRQEGSFALLKEMKDRMPSFTAECVARLLNLQGQKVLAARVLSGNLQLSVEDEQLQKEMVVAGGWLDPSAVELATLIGLSEMGLQKIKGDTSPGYQLLSLAYHEDKLNQIYPAIQKTRLALDDFSRQIEEQDCFPGLHYLLNRRVNVVTQDEPVKILPLSFDHIDPALLRVAMTESDLFGYQVSIGSSSGNPVHPRVIRIGNKLLAAAGDEPTFSKTRGQFSRLRYNNKIQQFQSDNGLSVGLCHLNWGGFLQLINRSADLECYGLGRKVLADLESGRVEKSLEADDFSSLASDYFVLELKKPEVGFSLLKAGLQRGGRMHLGASMAHSMGFQCSTECGYDVDDSSNQKQCANLPTLREKLQSVAVKPYAFTYNKSL